MPNNKQWYVYQNLNEKTDCIVAEAGVMVPATYTVEDGPFDSEEEAEERAEEIRRRVEPAG